MSPAEPAAITWSHTVFSAQAHLPHNIILLLRLAALPVALTLAAAVLLPAAAVVAVVADEEMSLLGAIECLL